MKSSWKIMFAILLHVSCAPYSQDWFVSEKYESSKGEVVYINSLNWGITGDKQMTIITKDKSRLRMRSDSIGTVKGLNPFIYRFQNDTLKVYFLDEISYRPEEAFETIRVMLYALPVKEYHVLGGKCSNDGPYFIVPRIKDQEYPKDMPVPSK